MSEAAALVNYTREEFGSHHCPPFCAAMARQETRQVIDPPPPRLHAATHCACSPPSSL